MADYGDDFTRAFERKEKRLQTVTELLRQNEIRFRNPIHRKLINPAIDDVPQF